MANSLYSFGRQQFLEGSIAYLTDDIKVILLNDSYVPSLDGHHHYSDVLAFVVSVPQTLTGKTSSFGVADANDVTFNSVPSGITIGYILIYKDSGLPSVSPLIGLISDAVGLPVVTTNANIKITWSDKIDKIFKL